MTNQQQQVLNSLVADDAAERKQLYAALRPRFNESDLAVIPTPTLHKMERMVNGNHPPAPVFNVDDGADLEVIPFPWGDERAS